MSAYYLQPTDTVGLNLSLDWLGQVMAYNSATEYLIF